MDRNTEQSSKPDGKTGERLVFDKDQPSEPAGGPNPGRYKKALPRREYSRIASPMVIPSDHLS